MRGSTLLVGACVCASAYLLVGCVGRLIEIKEMTPEQDLSTAPVDTPDMAEVELGPPRFFPDIQKDIEAKGCTLGACHGGTQTPVLKANPMTQADKDANYTNFTSECNTTIPMNSLILQKALGMPSHSGGAILTTSDPVYTRWLDWIGGGELK